MTHHDSYTSCDRCGVKYNKYSYTGRLDGYEASSSCGAVYPLTHTAQMTHYEKAESWDWHKLRDVVDLDFCYYCYPVIYNHIMEFIASNKWSEQKPITKLNIKRSWRFW